jgi:acyl-CoA thioester hydrolase
MKLLIELSLKPNWSDMDALGHVNNARYFTYFEEARLRWFHQVGLAASLSGKAEEGPVLVSATCNYLKAIVYPADIHVLMYAEPPGRSSFLLHYKVMINEEPFAEGSTKVVWVNYRLKKSVPLPEEVCRYLPDRI